MTSARRRGNDGREGGFAMVAALMGVVMFALLAYAVLAADRGAAAGLDAQLRRARLEAAADAGLATAAAGLGLPDNDRWPADGSHRTLGLDTVTLDISIEDERSKVPINGLDEAQMRRLVGAGGVPPGAVERVAASLLNWQDGAERTGGATRLDYAADDIRERSGPVRTLGELAVVRGVTQDLLDRIAPFTTVLGTANAFDPKTASAVALGVMSPSGQDAPDAIIRAREEAGERAKLDAAPAVSYIGRPVTVRIVAHDDGGGVFRLAAMVELTGQPKQPYLVRALD